MLSFLLLFFLQILSNSTKSEKLIFVETHFRHGARATLNLDSENKDLVKEIWAKPGEIIGIGERSHYLLGLRNRKRYITDTHFLSEIYDSHELLVYSTSVKRTLVSVYSQLQGLYPQNQLIGDTLTKEEAKKAYPMVSIDYPEITEELKRLKNLNNTALPNLMTLIPVYTFNKNEKKINQYDIDNCTIVRDRIKKYNRETMNSLINITKIFNEKYQKALNEFYNEKITYDFVFMNSFCDAYISSYVGVKNFTEFQKTGIDIEEMKTFCDEVKLLDLRDHFLGGKDHSMAKVGSSKLIKEMVEYIKKRVEADIKGEKYEDNIVDYSKPKMVMISGHDSTTACYQMFILNIFDVDYKKFKMPEYTAQIAFEVTRPDDIEDVSKLKYKDYSMNIYFNDDLMVKSKLDEFIEKVEKNAWSDKQVNDYCEWSNEEKEGITSNKVQLALNIIFPTLCLIFISSTIILGIKLKKQKQETDDLSLKLKDPENVIEKNDDEE